MTSGPAPQRPYLVLLAFAIVISGFVLVTRPGVAHAQTTTTEAPTTTAAPTTTTPPVSTSTEHQELLQFLAFGFGIIVFFLAANTVIHAVSS